MRYPSAYAAVLRQSQSDRAAAEQQPGLMAMSTMPMRSRDDSGRLRLVNLEPERVGDAFLPDNARIKLSIGDRADAGVKILGRDISIVPLDVNAVPGVASGDAVMFSNSAEDSDHIVRVTPAGADSLVQLRSSKAPTRFRYRVDLPAGGTLRQTSTGDIAVSQAARGDDHQADRLGRRPAADPRYRVAARRRAHARRAAPRPRHPLPGHA